MKLQILIPQYNETEEILSVLLNSIQIQQNVSFSDFGVIICSDGSDICPSKEFLSQYTFKIEYHWLEHHGVSATRNTLMDLAVADYIMFCDADDMLFWPYALEMIFNAIEKEDFDYMSSDFIEEVGIRGETKRTYVRHGKESLYAWRTVIRRHILSDNRIRFYENLTMSEDYGFNILARYYCKKHYYCKDPFYLWMWRDDSACRKDPNSFYSTFPPVIVCRSLTVYDFISRKIPDQAIYELIILAQDVYTTIHSDDWKSSVAIPYAEQSIQVFKQYVGPLVSLWSSISNEVKNAIMLKHDNKHSGAAVIEWIDSILSECRNTIQNGSNQGGQSL